MDRLRFGTGGSPFSSQKRSTLSGIERIAELGLECLEVEFVHGVKMSAEEAARIRERSAALDVKLSAHGPYYINLASLEKQKIGASRAMLLQTAKACQAMGADRFTFHPAFYQQRSSEEVYPIVKEQLQLLRTSLLENGITAVQIRPELTGKPTQFGNLEELIRLAHEVEGVALCVDFAHAQARSGGQVNGYDDFAGMLTQIKSELGKATLEDMHIHMSGINFTAKGERNHLVLEEAEIDWRALMQALKDFKVKGLVICESPNLEEDALKMQEYYEGIGGRG